jgi:hypothetical protein
MATPDTFIGLHLHAASEDLVHGWIMSVGIAVVDAATGNLRTPTRQFTFPPDQNTTATYDTSHIPATSIIPAKYHPFIEPRVYTQFWATHEQEFLDTINDLQFAPDVPADDVWHNIAITLSQLHRAYPLAAFVTNCSDFAFARIQHGVSASSSARSLGTAPFHTGIRTYYDYDQVPPTESRHRLIDTTTLRHFIGKAESDRITAHTLKRVPESIDSQDCAHRIALWALGAYLTLYVQPM